MSGIVGACGAYTYSLIITPFSTGIIGGGITLNQGSSPKFNVSLAPTLNT